MWFEKTRALQDLVAALRAENSDLRQQVRFLTQTAHDRETKLIDRILAITHPAAHREVHPPAPRPAATLPPGYSEHQRRVNLPGVGMVPPPAGRPSVAVEGPNGNQMQGSSEAERVVHTHDDGGSNPSPAPIPEEPADG